MSHENSQQRGEIESAPLLFNYTRTMRVESERRAATDGVVHSRGAIIKGALSVMSLYRRVTRRLSLEWCVFHLARKVYVRTHFKNETRRNVYAGKKINCKLMEL